MLDEIGFIWTCGSAQTTNDKLWHRQHEKLVEFKRNKGHCVVPDGYEHDKSLGRWVSKQRKNHKNNKIRPDRKRILDEIEFVWKDEGTGYNFKPDDKLWHQQHEKLVEFKRKMGHCKVPQQYEQDKSLGRWVATQRTFHKDDKLRLDRKELLDNIGFAWKAYALAAPSPPTSVRRLVIRSFSTLWADHVSHFFSPTFL
jgi:hypothetical protein